jgi:peptidoglycan hydrolase-like protein with peptidoglycan-binding domain
MGGGSSKQTEVTAADLRLGDVDMGQQHPIASRRVKQNQPRQPDPTVANQTSRKGKKKGLSISIPRSNSFIAEIQEVSITIHSARTLRGSSGNPYVLVTLLDGTTTIEEKITSAIYENHARPTWDEIFRFLNPPANGIFRIEVWDQETPNGARPGKGADNLLGMVKFSVHSLPSRSLVPRNGHALVVAGTPVTPLPHVLQGDRAEGNILLSFETTMTSPPAPITPKTMPMMSPRSLRTCTSEISKRIAVRKEIRNMPVVEQERFSDAVVEMMDNGNFFRLATHYSEMFLLYSHQESFPAFNRAHVCAFERELMNADVALGRDGCISVPYYDWTNLNIQQQAYSVVLDAYFKEVPEEFARQVKDNTDFINMGYQLQSSSVLEKTLQNMHLSKKVDQLMSNTEHWRFASTRAKGGISLETLNHDVQVAFGYPMASRKYAAYHPISLLHHCNLDRIYSKFLEAEVDARSEFVARQRALQQQGETNRFDRALEGFRHPLKTDETIYVRDLFDTKELGYVYDTLPSCSTQKIKKQNATFCLFPNVKPSLLTMSACILHVFVTKRESNLIYTHEDKWKDFILPKMNEENTDLSSLPEYAGCSGLLRETISSSMNIFVEITATMEKIGVASRESESMKIMVVCELCEMNEGEEKWLFILPEAIPSPIIVGPTFDADGKSWKRIEKWKESTQNLDVIAIQKYLVCHGYFLNDSKTFSSESAMKTFFVDGLFGPETESALKKFQIVAGITSEDGVVGTMTKKAIVRPRYDHEKDFHHDDAEISSFVCGETIYVIVGCCPGYLDNNSVMEDVTRVAQQWEQATGVLMKIVERKSSKMMKCINIKWKDLLGVDETIDFLTRFNTCTPSLGSGGGSSLSCVSRSEPSTCTCIYLDASELWCVTNTPSKPFAFRIYNVLLHQFGKVLGLRHSHQNSDVMHPFYLQDPLKMLSANDVSRGKNICTSV